MSVIFGQWHRSDCKPYPSSPSPGCWRVYQTVVTTSPLEHSSIWKCKWLQMFRPSIQCDLCFIFTYNVWCHYSCWVFVIERALTAKMSVKIVLTVSCFKKKLTAQCVLSCPKYLYFFKLLTDETYLIPQLRNLIVFSFAKIIVEMKRIRLTGCFTQWIWRMVHTGK